MEGKEPSDEMKVSKMIRLKEFKLREELFSYIRANIINQNDQQRAESK